MKYILFFVTIFSMLLCFPMKVMDISTLQKQEISVSVQGEVEESKIVQVKRNATIEDVLKQVILSPDADLSSINLLQQVVDQDVIVIGKKEEFAQKVSINDATLEELMSVKGIGETKAKSIIAYREMHGRFQSLQDLMNINGIKEKTWNKLKDYLRL